jgi:hypothetical protein
MFLEFDDLESKPSSDCLGRVAAGVYAPQDLVWIIEHWRNPETISPDLLIELLADEYPELRGVSAWALGKIGNPSSIPALTRVLESDYDDVRHACAFALGRIRNKLAKEG